MSTHRPKGVTALAISFIILAVLWLIPIPIVGTIIANLYLYLLFIAGALTFSVLHLAAGFGMLKMKKLGYRLALIMGAFYAIVGYITTQITFFNSTIPQVIVITPFIITLGIIMGSIILLVYGLGIIIYLKKVRYEFEGVKKFPKKAEIEIKKEIKEKEQKEVLKGIPTKTQQTETEKPETRKKCPFCGTQVEANEIKCPKCGGII